MIIHLIASPRNVSTAFMYSMNQHHDIYPVDEPFYGCYLTESGKVHPDWELVLSQQSTDRRTVFREIQAVELEHPVVFLKNMAHHIREEDFLSMGRWNHIFLIRHPRLHIRSFSKVIKYPRMDDLGITTQRKWYDTLVSQGHKPHIIDSNHLLENPEKELRRICDRVGINFDPSMLSWTVGPKPFDGCWGHHWYRSAWASTEFGEPKDPDKTELPDYLTPLLEACLVDYEYLYDQINK